SHKSQVTSHKSQVTSHKSQVTSHKSQVIACQKEDAYENYSPLNVRVVAKRDVAKNKRVFVSGFSHF
ncbi:hypothetical protein QVL73_02900, partial [Bartonella henselae]